MNNKYVEYIANIDITSVYGYKILLLLNTKSYTQAQLSTMLNLQKQNTSKYVRELAEMGLIEVDRIEGKNKFFRAVTSIEKLKTHIKGQIKF